MGPANFKEIVTTRQPVSMDRIPVGKSESFDAKWIDGTRAVVKFARETLPNGKHAQRGIPVRSHPKREVAFWRLAKTYGWDGIVPETVLAHVDGKEASVQAWVVARPLSAYRPELKVHDANWDINFRAASRMFSEKDLLKLLVLDFVAGARDRHASNVGARVRVAPGATTFDLVAWDNAVAFGKTLRFYHQMFHHFVFCDRINFDPVWDDFVAVSDDAIRSSLLGLISVEEVEHACVRRRFLEDFPYRMPWKILSQGQEDPKTFPTYERLFEEASKKISDLNAVVV